MHTKMTDGDLKVSSVGPLAGIDVNLVWYRHKHFAPGIQIQLNAKSIGLSASDKAHVAGKFVQRLHDSGSKGESNSPHSK